MCKQKEIVGKKHRETTPGWGVGRTPINTAFQPESG